MHAAAPGPARSALLAAALTADLAFASARISPDVPGGFRLDLIEVLP